MNSESIFWFFKKFEKDSLSLLYSGLFTEEVLRKVMDLSEIKINSLEELRKKKKRMLFLMAEGFQNIIKHGEKTEKTKKNIEDKNFFSTINRGDVIFICTGNLVENTNVDNLKKQILEVNSLDEAELKDLYKYVMQHGRLSSKGGAGLGIITMARKSDQKLNYIFEKYNDKLSLYYSQIILKAKEEISEQSVNEILPLSESIDLHKKMIENNILIIQKGDFSQDSLNPVLHIIKNNLHEEITESEQINDAYKIVLKMLENIDKHGFEVNEKKEGIFILAKKNNQFVICTGNFIENKNIEALNNRLILLDELKNKNELTGNKGNEIGFIDITQVSKEPLEFSFEKIDNQKSFFSLSVTL
ncbi:MAG: hypothetical protein GXO79_13290 [Chlorobi bacterium]|nr:hypothetical protein [Chlorobiota bacterium]